MTLGKEPMIPMRANTSKLENVTFGVYNGLPRGSKTRLNQLMVYQPVKYHRWIWFYGKHIKHKDYDQA